VLESWATVRLKVRHCKFNEYISKRSYGRQLWLQNSLPLTLLKVSAASLRFEGSNMSLRSGCRWLQVVLNEVAVTGLFQLKQQHHSATARFATLSEAIWHHPGPLIFSPAASVHVSYRKLSRGNDGRNLRKLSVEDVDSNS